MLQTQEYNIYQDFFKSEQKPRRNNVLALQGTKQMGTEIVYLGRQVI